MIKRSHIKSKIKTKVYLWLYFFLIATGFTFATEKNGVKEKRLLIIAGGESHGMLESCDCEKDPGGGVAKRASLLKSLGDRQSILLLDAGGFSAGGIYDNYTGGRKDDSLRTVLMIAAMGMMGYDAVAIGDDDLLFGGGWLTELTERYALPLVCANCFLPDGKPLAAKYRIVKKADIRIGITAVCTQESFFDTDTEVVISDPVTAIRKIWQEMAQQSDVKIILSHLGQEKSTELFKAFPNCDVLVNGHRKYDKEPVVMIDGKVMMQFGFQGKSLSAVNLYLKGGKIETENARWLDIIPEIPDDKEIMEILSGNKKINQTENIYDLYIMSQCPYGLEALGEFLKFAAKNQAVNWALWFIGSVENDSGLLSLHGDGEILDEIRWLAVRQLYPDRWKEFLRLRVDYQGPTADIIKKCGIDSVRIEKWASLSGEAELSKHYFRSMRLSVGASPTLLVNNRPFEKKITQVNLQRFHCLSVNEPSPVCDSLPECTEDADCRKPKKLGVCKKGKCSFVDAVPFKFTVLKADSTFAQPEKKVIARTMELFPGADVEVIGTGTKRGKELLKKYNPDALPFYLFGKEVKLTHNFSDIEAALMELPNAYSFSKGTVIVNYYPKRKKNKGLKTLFVDPFFLGISDIFRIIGSDPVLMKDITIEPIIYSSPSEARRGTEEWFRQEEALRWIVLRKISPSILNQYLAAYSEKPGTSYWKESLPSSFPEDSLIAAIKKSNDLLKTHWETVRSLDIRGPVVFLIDNVETVPVSSERELRRVLMPKRH